MSPGAFCASHSRLSLQGFRLIFSEQWPSSSAAVCLPSQILRRRVLELKLKLKKFSILRVSRQSRDHQLFLHVSLRLCVQLGTASVFYRLHTVLDKVEFFRAIPSGLGAANQLQIRLRSETRTLRYPFTFFDLKTLNVRRC